MAKLTSIIQPGAYTCQGRSSMMGREHPVQGTARVAPGLNGFWQTVVYEERKTPDNPNPVSTEERFSFDQSTGQFVRVAVDNMGGHSTMSAPAGEGNRLMFSGEDTMGGRRTPGRFTITQVSPREVNVTLVHEGGAAGSQGAATPPAGGTEGAAGQPTNQLQLTCRR